MKVLFFRLQAVLEPKAFLEEYNLSAYVLDYEGTNVLHWFLGQTKKDTQILIQWQS